VTTVGERDSNNVYEDSSDRIEKDYCATFSSSWLGYVRTVVVEVVLNPSQARCGTDSHFISSLGRVI
jgi:hypothetical protein